MQHAEQIICVNPCNLWLNSCFISAKDGNGFTLPHELTHIVGNTFHIGGMPWNLMYDSWIVGEENRTPFASKRLLQAQEGAIRKDRYNLLR